MSFIMLILKNLVRQPVRAGLTVLGISIGITTVVALGVVTGGLEATAADVIRTGGADFMVAQEGTADLSFSTVFEDDWAAIAERPDVARATGALLHVTRVSGNPLFLLMGVEPGQLAENPPALREGAVMDPEAADQIMLGSGAARTLDAGVGDVVEIDDRAFRVTGVYQTGNTWQDGGAYAPLDAVQVMTAKPGVVTLVWVEVAEGEDPAAVARSIEEDLPNLTTISEVGEYGEVDQGLQLMDAANLAISVLAVGIGAIGVMNTMVMSVFERTREIGILRAVGWSGGRILRMVVGESLLLCLVAAAAGSALGVLASRAVLLIPTVASFLQPQYAVEVFVRALLVAVIVALVGAAYPAYRAVRLTPMEALRYE